MENRQQTLGETTRGWQNGSKPDRF